MRPVRFLHAADLHLDSPFRGHVDAAGDFGAALRDATFATFARLIDTAIQEKVDFVLLAGDLYDAKDRSLRAQLKLRDGLAKLDAAGIRSFVVHGNHDPLSGRYAQLALPPSVHVFDGTVATVSIKQDWDVVASITGVSYARADVTENLAATFPTPPSDSKFPIALLHANVGGDEGHANYAPCTLSDLAGKGYRYWALGHVHTPVIHKLPGGGDAVAAYPGNPQGRSVRETGPRGVLLGEFNAGVLTTRTIAIDEVRWHRVPVSIDGLDSIDELEERIAEEVRSRTGPSAGTHEPSGHVMRLDFTGRGALHSTLAQAAELDQFKVAMRKRWLESSSARRFVLIEGMTDKTGRRGDCGTLLTEPTLLGDALRLASTAAAPGSDARTKLLAEFETLWKKTGATVERPGEAAIGDIIERAAELCIDLLDDDGPAPASVPDAKVGPA